MLIGHKEFRYISPVFPALIYWSMLGVDVVLRYIQRIDKTPRSLSSSGYLLLGVLTVLSFLESNDPKRYFPADTTPLQVRMREVLDLDETKETKQEDCVVMDGIDWTWTRFDLLLGRSIPRHIYFYNHQKDASYDASVKTCRFAIVAYDRIREFQTLTSHAFQLQAKTRRGDVLLVRSLQGPRNL